MMTAIVTCRPKRERISAKIGGFFMRLCTFSQTIDRVNRVFFSINQTIMKTADIDGQSDCVMSYPRRVMSFDSAITLVDD